MTIIKPRTLQGFRDFLPDAMIPRERLLEAARTVYRSYGFVPIDTPALEYLEILQGKGGEETDRQLYHFCDQGGRRVGMRFDLTVPLARFVAQHIGELGTPFKRYQMAPVWRGERPQRGRYREFMQCDFDTIGTLSVAADIETVLVIYDLMQAVGLPEVTLRINHRQILNGLLVRMGLSGQSTDILRCLDKLPKVGPQSVAEEMIQVTGASSPQVDQLLKLSQLQGTHDEILSQLEPFVAGSEIGQAGAARLREVLRGALAAGVPAQRLLLDVSIARGLDYYTGTIVETFLDALPAIGSVCSGGRYDDLAGLYTRQSLPGIGASLGLDRLLSAMQELHLIDGVSSSADVFIPFFDAQRLEDYLRLSARLRSAGLRVELYPEPRKIGQQLKYASQRGFRVAVIAGEQEFAAGNCQVKDLVRRTSQEVPVAAGYETLVATIRQLLAESPRAAE